MHQDSSSTTEPYQRLRAHLDSPAYAALDDDVRAAVEADVQATAAELLETTRTAIRAERLAIEQALNELQSGTSEDPGETVRALSQNAAANGAMLVFLLEHLAQRAGSDPIAGGRFGGRGTFGGEGVFGGVRADGRTT